MSQDEKGNLLQVRIPIALQHDYEKLKEACRKKGIHFSTWVRARLFKSSQLQPRTLRLPQELAERLVTLNKINSQINALERSCCSDHQKILKEISTELHQLRIAIAHLTTQAQG